LLANEGKAARERLALIRIFEELRGLGYDGSYDAVRRYAKVWRVARGAATAEAYVPLSFAPGEAYQFDWSHEVVLINGTTVTVKVAHVRLCHSRMLFVRAYPRETQEMVFDAHNRAFAFFKGTCTRGIYDNMKTAVETVLIGKDRQFNRRFQRMCGHYLVEPTACTPAAGWEKGQVENQVGLVRERFFTPRLRVTSATPCSRSSSAMVSRASQIGTSTASVVESLASMKRWSASWRSRLSPTVGMTSPAMRVAKFSFSTTISREVLILVSGVCDARSLSRNSSCGQSIGTRSRKSATLAKRACSLLRAAARASAGDKRICRPGGGRALPSGSFASAGRAADLRRAGARRS
jgi:transposase